MQLFPIAVWPGGHAAYADVTKQVNSIATVDTLRAGRIFFLSIGC